MRTKNNKSNLKQGDLVRIICIDNDDQQEVEEFGIVLSIKLGPTSYQTMDSTVDVLWGDQPHKFIRWELEKVN